MDIPSLIILGLNILIITCIFLAWYFSYRARHKERMLMIEKGMNPNIHLKHRLMFIWLKIGVIVIGLSVGLIINGLLANYKIFENSKIIPIAILGICGGGSLVVSYYIQKDKS